MKGLIKLLRFSFVHSLRDMGRNRSRTLFALLCVATGVASVVALRSLAFMVGDELTTNLAQLNRGDIRVYASRGVPEMVEISAQAQPVFTAEAVQAMQNWADEEDVALSFANFAVFTQLRSVAEGDAGETQTPTPVVPLYIDPATYPFYDEVSLRAPAGISFEEAFVPGDVPSVVISNKLALQAGQNLQIGDLVRIGASETPYRVSGIARSNSESPLTVPQTAFFDYVYLSLADDTAPLPDQAFIKVPLGRDIGEVEASLIAYLERTFDPDRDYDEELNRASVPELEEQNAETADIIDDMILTLGLSSLLIGGIGIVNTMLVVVSRRTLEIAVLKTLGLKAYRVTILFLVEALLMGLVGSIIGVIGGVALSYAIRDVGERAFGLALEWRLHPAAMFSGLSLGVVITGLFGFLPTLVAGQVRPAVVLRPNEAQMPAAGLLQMLLTLIATIIVLGLLVSTIVEDRLSFDPVIMLSGALAFFGLFVGLILSNTWRGTDLGGARRRLWQGLLYYGAFFVGAALASFVLLVLSEVWKPFGLGTSKPVGDLITALDRGRTTWLAAWLALTLLFGGLVRWWARPLAALIGLTTTGITIGGLVGYLVGRGLEAVAEGTGFWSRLESLSTGFVLVEGAMVVMGIVFVLYWLLVWGVGKLSPSVLVALVSVTVVGMLAGAVSNVALLGSVALIALTGLALAAGVLLWRWAAQVDQRHTNVAWSGQARAGAQLAVGLAAITGGFLLVDAAGSRLWWGGGLVTLAVVVWLWLQLRRTYAVDGRLILREMAGRRTRVASTLLGLSVGVAGLAIVSLTTTAVSHLLEIQLGENAEGNLLVVDPLSSQAEEVRAVLDASEHIDHYAEFVTYRAVLLRIDGEEVSQRGPASHFGNEDDESGENGNFERVEHGIQTFVAQRPSLDDLPDYEISQGRILGPDDVGTNRMMLRESFFTEQYGIGEGSRLMMLFENDPGEEDDVLIQFRVVGLISRQSGQTGLEEQGDQFLLPPGSVPDRVQPTASITIVEVDRSDDAYMDELLVALADVPNIITLDVSVITQLLENLIAQLRAIPTLVAYLALVAGTAIIANTVALATQERRRQIGVMKAVGLKGRRVLSMLMIENGLIGLIAGVIGVAVGFLLTVILVLTSNNPDELNNTIEYSTMGWLILMSIGVAVGAAMLSAWSAASEKPMNVLRYE